MSNCKHQELYPQKNTPNGFIGTCKNCDEIVEWKGSRKPGILGDMEYVAEISNAGEYNKY